MVRFLPISLHKDEEVLAVVRKSPLAMAGKFLFAFVWFLVPFLFFFPLLRLGGAGLLVFVALLFGAIFYGVRLWRRMKNTMLVVTDHRVIDVDQSSWRKREVVDVPLMEVKTVVTERARWMLGWFDVGMLRLETGDGASFDLEWSHVRHPQVVADLLREAQSLHRS